MYFFSRLLSLTLLPGIAAVALLPVVTQAGPFREVVEECKKRTHVGDSVCTSIVRNNLTIANCKERAGLSDEECAKKIEEIKADPEFSGKPMAPAPSIKETPKIDPVRLTPRTSSTRNDDLIGRIRTKRETNLNELAKRTETVTNFLKSRGVDMTAIEAAFPEFEKKAENLLSAYDTYRATYIGTMRDTSSARASLRGEARLTVLRARNELIEYYQTKILTPLRVAREKIL